MEMILSSDFFDNQIATLIAVYANWNFAAIEGIGWGWAGVIWLYNIIFYFPLDIIKFFIRYALSGRAWDLVLERRVRVAVRYTQIRQLTCFTYLLVYNVPFLKTYFFWGAGCFYEAKGFWKGTAGA